MCEFVDEWNVLETTQNVEFVCFQSRDKSLWKPVCRCRQTGALCARSFVVAQLAQCALVERSFLSDFSSQENCPFHHSTIHFITQKGRKKRGGEKKEEKGKTRVGRKRGGNKKGGGGGGGKREEKEKGRRK